MIKEMHETHEHFNVIFVDYRCSLQNTITFQVLSREFFQKGIWRVFCLLIGLSPFPVIVANEGL